MVRTSIGQINAESAQHIYRVSRKLADALVKSGKIAPADRQIAFAKIASERLGAMKIQISKSMAKQASKSVPALEKILGSGAGTAQFAKATGRSAASAGTQALVRQSAAQAAKGTAASAAPLAAAIFAIETAYNGVQFARGKMTREELKRRTARSAAANGGGVAGAAAGAAIGSIFPGPGTVVGAVVGGIVAGMAGSIAADKAMGAKD